MGLKLDEFHWHNYNILIALWPVGSTSLEPRLYMQRVDVRRSSILDNVQDYCVYIGWVHKDDLYHGRLSCALRMKIELTSIMCSTEKHPLESRT